VIKFSIIIPVVNEAAILRHCLQQLSHWQQQGHEVIVVDGGSTDETSDISIEYADFSLESKSGRAHQMNVGAAQASGDIFIFLHADTRLPVNALDQINKNIKHHAQWGRFDIRFKARGLLFSLIATMMNFRSRITSVATGDQVIFVTRDAFEKVGGFPDIALMEDIALSKKLRAYSAPACISTKVISSARRWQKKGVWKTIWLMWTLRWRYWRGVCPNSLARDYEQ